MTVNFCLFGAGRIGRIHAANLAIDECAVLKCIVDVNEAAAAELAAATGAVAADADSALADPSIDAIVIASSTDTHLPLIEAAAAAGKAVFCEKPLDLDAANARRAVTIAEDAGILLRVGFNRRHDPSFRRLKDAIRDGTIGAVEVISITSRDPAPPPLDYIRRSGGLIHDMSIHDLDMARWLLGAEPTSVFASGACVVDPAIAAVGDIDTAVIVLQTASGAFCQITNSRRCTYGYDQRVEVFGAEGMLRIGNETATRVEQAGAFGFQREPALPFFLERYRDAYRLEIAAFIRGVEGAGCDVASGEDGVRALELADAAERSRRTQAVVELV